jgi:hypothetical protein
VEKNKATLYSTKKQINTSCWLLEVGLSAAKTQNQFYQIHIKIFNMEHVLQTTVQSAFLSTASNNEMGRAQLKPPIIYFD